MSCGSTTCNSNIPISFVRESSAPARSPWLSRVLAKLRLMLDRFRRREIAIEFEKVRQRRILLELDDRLLRDIGITRAEAMREARKAFWK